MRNHIFTLFVAIGLLGASQASADPAVLTGKACKKHISAANVTSVEIFEKSKYTNPKETKLKDFDFQEGMTDRAAGYVTGVKAMLRECKRHCEGLPVGKTKLFTCSALPKATPNIILRLTQDNTLLADTASLAVEAVSTDDLTSSFEPQAEQDKDLAETNSAPTARNERSNGAHKNYYIQRADEPQEELIEL